MGARLDIPKGKRFGRLKVIRELEQVKSGRRFLCKCDCGAKSDVRLGNLSSGAVSSCGCANREATSKRMTTHGLTNHPLYLLLTAMKARCNNPNADNYIHYGGRGIRVFRKWQRKPETFIAWALANGWKPGLEIDRKNNDKDYKPSNCRFVTRTVNNRNKNNNHLVLWKGKEMTLAEALEMTGNIVSHQTAQGRVKRGWKMRDVLRTPAGTRR